MDYYDYGSYDAAFESAFGGLAILMVILSIIIIALVVGIIATWKLFKKAGKKGWESIVPFYSYWVLVEIAGLNWWWFILIICDSVVSIFGIDDIQTITNLVSLFASFNCYYNIAKKFNKSTGYSVCAGIFSLIFVMIFGLSKKEIYNVNIPVSKNGVFGAVENVNNNNNYQANVEPQNFYNATANNISQEQNNEPIEQVQNFSFCGNCGTKLNMDDKFCPNCGKQKI